MKEKILRLIQHLENNPQIKKIFFNQDGDWLFHEHDKFPEAKSRDEILGIKDGLSDDTSPEPEVTKLENIGEPLKVLSQESEDYIVNKLVAENKRLVAENGDLKNQLDDLLKQAANKKGVKQAVTDTLVNAINEPQQEAAKV